MPNGASKPVTEFAGWMWLTQRACGEHIVLWLMVHGASVAAGSLIVEASGRAAGDAADAAQSLLQPEKQDYYAKDANALAGDDYIDDELADEGPLNETELAAQAKGLRTSTPSMVVVHGWSTDCNLCCRVGAGPQDCCICLRNIR